MPSNYDQAGMQPAFVQDQVDMYLDSFLLDHVFPDDYGLEEKDVVDIDGDPLFENELTTQADGVQPKQKNRRATTYTTGDDKLLCVLACVPAASRIG
ncbi:Eyes absent-like protein 4 [Hordeum vulgare]|nr:Eyes absent-like protein 4 [Hordeum vulgare]